MLSLSRILPLWSEWPAARRHAALLGALLVLPLLEVLPVFLFDDTFYYEDLASFYFPREELLVRSGFTGWNPHVFLGAQLAGDPQTAPWEPVRALCRMLGLAPTTGLACFLAFYLTIAVVGMYALAIRKGASPSGALLTVLGAVWGGLYLVRFRHVHVFTTLSLLPWILLFADRLFTSRRLADGLAIGVLLAWGALGGHPQIPYMAVLFVAAWLAVNVLYRVPRGERLRALWAMAWRAGAGVVAMAGLLAFYYGPVIPTMLGSGRGSGTNLEWAGLFSWHPLEWLRPFSPDLYGNDLKGNYFGPTNFHEGLLYIGIAPLLLVVLAIVWRERRSDRPLLMLAAGGAVLAAGKFMPLFYAFYFVVPGFKYFRSNCRYTFLATLCTALVAGLVFSDIVRDERPPEAREPMLVKSVRLVSRITAGLLLATTILALAWPGFDAVAKPGAHTTVAWGTTRAALLLLAAGWVLEKWLRRAWDGRRTGMAILLLTGIDLAVQWVPYRQTRPLAEAFPPKTITSALVRVAPARVLVYAHGPHGELEIEPLLNWGEAAGYDNVRGYNPGASVDIWKLLYQGDHYHRPMFRPPDLPAVWEPEEWLLNLTGVKRLVGHVRRWPANLAKLPVVAQEGGWEVRERSSAMPRAWLVSGAEVRPGDAALKRLPELDVARIATVDRPVGLPEGDAGDPGTATLSQLSPDEVVVEVDAMRPAVLVLADAYATGWRADVDGIDADMVRADFMFRGVRVEAGRHQVVFRYHVAGRKTGQWISLATAAVLAVLLGVLAVRRVRAERHPP